MTDSEVSLSYLLEYVLREFLPEKKRYINRLNDIEKLGRMDNAGYSTNDNYNSNYSSSQSRNPQEYKMPFIDNYMVYRNPSRSRSPKKPQRSHQNDDYPMDIDYNDDNAKYYSSPVNKRSPSLDRESGGGLKLDRRRLVNEIAKMKSSIGEKK